MIVANTNYTETLVRIEQIKTLISEFQDHIYTQIPQGLTKPFDNSKSNFLNNLEEIETNLIEFSKLTE